MTVLTIKIKFYLRLNFCQKWLDDFIMLIRPSLIMSYLILPLMPCNRKRPTKTTICKPNKAERLNRIFIQYFELFLYQSLTTMMVCRVLIQDYWASMNLSIYLCVSKTWNRIIFRRRVPYVSISIHKAPWALKSTTS